MASTALVAWIASAKFAWGSTLYRQAQILAGHGLNIDRQTLARWMKQAAWTVKGLYELQLAVMHSHPRLFCDETPVRMLDPHMGSFGSRGEIHSRIRKTPVVVSVSKVRARLHDLAVSSPDQPHIRSPFATAAPRSRLRRVGSGGRNHSRKRFFKPWIGPVRRPGSARTDQALGDSKTRSASIAWRLSSRLLR